MTTIHRFAVIAAIIALCVVVLGAWVRLSDAGLGCPDWPGCYGQMTWPTASDEIETANQAFPERPVEVGKAWREMVHRYLAGILVLMVVGLNWRAWFGSPTERTHRALTTFLLVLILFQAALGMWTVTLKLKPIIVVAHLAGGMLTFSLICWLAYRSSKHHIDPSPLARRLRPWVALGLVVLSGQILLGGWTSANYAALACTDLPMCQQQWLPETDFSEGFQLWREVGVDYEGGVLDPAARTAIHLTHRIGAVITLLVLGALAAALLRRPATRGGGVLLLTAVLAQFTLGMLNVVLYLPLWSATAHNAGAALLLAILVWLLHRTSRSRPPVPDYG
ncbi:MAG: COX15/CtaA family protein [Xanthomonadales bacterium]|nr:COX15/CtaA family protein [Xanthomonadales bacterium]